MLTGWASRYHEKDTVNGSTVYFYGESGLRTPGSEAWKKEDGSPSVLKIRLHGSTALTFRIYAPFRTQTATTNSNASRPLVSCWINAALPSTFPTSGPGTV